MLLSLTDILVPKYDPRMTEGISHKSTSYLTPPIMKCVAEPIRVVMVTIKDDVATDLCIGIPKSRFWDNNSKKYEETLKKKKESWSFPLTA